MDSGWDRWESPVRRCHGETALRMVSGPLCEVLWPSNQKGVPPSSPTFSGAAHVHMYRSSLRGRAVAMERSENMMTWCAQFTHQSLPDFFLYDRLPWMHQWHRCMADYAEKKQDIGTGWSYVKLFAAISLKVFKSRSFVTWTTLIAPGHRLNLKVCLEKENEWTLIIKVIDQSWMNTKIIPFVENPSSLGLSGSDGSLHVLLLPCALHLDFKRKLWWWKWLGLWRNYSSDIVFVCFCCVSGKQTELSL